MDDQPNHIFKEKKLIFLPEKPKSVVIQSTLRAVGVVNRFGLIVHVFDENWQTVATYGLSIAIVLKRCYLSLTSSYYRTALRINFLQLFKMFVIMYDLTKGHKNFQIK